MRIQVLAVVVALAVPAATWAQPKPKLADQLKELSAKVDEALKAAAEGSATAKALEDLAAKLTALEQEVQKQQTVGQGYEVVRRKVEDYDNRLGNLELELAALKMQAADSGSVAGYSDGFFLRSPNRKFLLRIGGLAQAGYIGRVFSEERLSSGDLVGANESSFLLRRARLGMGGHLLNWRLSYQLELEFGPADPGPLLEGWGELHIHRMVRVRGGKQKIPFARQFLIHSAYQQFIERSGPTDSFAPGWDLGLVVLGDIPLAGIISYQLGIFNGAGSSATQDDNTDFLYAARLVYQPLGPISYAEGDAEVSKLKLAVGGAFAYNLARTDIAERKGVTDPTKAAGLQDADADGNVDNVGIYHVGAELGARLGGLAWQNELFYRQEDPGAVASSRSFWGVYSQASFFHFDTTLELAARYGYWQPHYYGLERQTLRPDSVHEVAVVLNGLVWLRRVKWQVEYMHQWLVDLQSSQQQFGETLKVNQVRVQMQLAF